MTSQTKTERALESAVLFLLREADRYAVRHDLSLSTVSRRIFDDARVIERLWGGTTRITLWRLIRAANRLRILKETK